jgi:transcriptional regulator with XRE-family HTH domain
MDPDKRKAMEEAGYRFGDFADFLGMDEVARKMTEFRADLGSAIRRIREARGETQAKFAQAIGSTQPKVARMEVAAPEVSLDLMLKALYLAGGVVRYEFEPSVAEESLDQRTQGRIPRVVGGKPVLPPDSEQRKGPKVG